MWLVNSQRVVVFADEGGIVRKRWVGCKQMRYFVCVYLMANGRNSVVLWALNCTLGESQKTPHFQ